MKLTTVAAQFLLIGSAIFSDGVVMAQTIDWGLKSAILEEEMTETQVIRAIGFRPNKVELKTCGSDSQHGSWNFKKFTFGNTNNGLTVFFRRSETSWIVNNWFVEP